MNAISAELFQAARGPIMLITFGVQIKNMFSNISAVLGS